MNESLWSGLGGLFGQGEKPRRGFNWENAALTLFGAGPQVQQRQQMRQQQAALQLRQDEAEREIAQRESLQNNLTKSAELGGFGVSPGEAERIMTNPEAFGTRFNERYGNFDASPGETRYTPNGGGASTVTQAPIAEAQMGSWLDTQDPSGRLRGAYARRQAFPPQTITEGGGVVGMRGNNQLGYLVEPDSVEPAQPSGPPAPAGAPGEAPAFNASPATGGVEPWVAPEAQAQQAAPRIPAFARPGEPGHSFRDPVYDQIEANVERQIGIPGLASEMRRVRIRGEASNANQTSSANARTVYQVIPGTRQLFQQRNGVDAYASGNDAAMVAGLHLADSYRRTGSWDRARAEYFAGPDSRRHGPATRRYTARTSVAGAPRQPVRVRSAEDARRLPRGTVFVTPDGRRKVR